MGNFYTNFSLRGVTQAAVAGALAGRSALVAQPVNDIVIVFDEQSDAQDPAVMNALAARLCTQCNCPVLAAMNHDDDVLWYNLFIGGESVDEYNSCPGYFDDAVEADAPSGGDPAKLAAAFGVTDIGAVEKALRAPGEDYIFAIERHTDLATALGLPSYVVGGGYTYVAAGELPEGVSQSDLVRTA